MTVHRQLSLHVTIPIRWGVPIFCYLAHFLVIFCITFGPAILIQTFTLRPYVILRSFCWVPKKESLYIPSHFIRIFRFEELFYGGYKKCNKMSTITSHTGFKTVRAIRSGRERAHTKKLHSLSRWLMYPNAKPRKVPFKAFESSCQQGVAAPTEGKRKKSALTAESSGANYGVISGPN